MDFTFPIRPSFNRRWARPEPPTHDESQVDQVQHDDERNELTHVLKPTKSLHNLNAAKSANPLKSAKSTNRLRRAPSRSQLAPVNNDRVMKPSQRKPAIKPGPEVESSVSRNLGETVSEETWALVTDHAKQEATAKELNKNLARLNLRAKQSSRRIRSIEGQSDQKESTEEIVRKLTPADIPINVHLCLSFQSLDPRSLITAPSIRILANELPDLDAFSAELQAAHGDETGVMLLRSMPPERWTFQSRLEANRVGNHVTIGGFEYRKTGGPADAQEMYEDFLRFLNEKGRHEARELVEKTKERLEATRRARKGMAEFTASGSRREFPEVHVPEAVDVQGYVDVFL